MEDYILKIKNLSSYSFGEYNMDHLNLNLEPGKVRAVIGKNGSELEYFINCLVGKEKDITGRIVFRGQRIDHLLRKNNNLNNIDGISFLLQEALLIDHFTIAENLAVVNYPFRNLIPIINWRSVNDKARRILEKLDFNLDYRTQVNELSAEDRKKVSIARAFIENPDVIIMYEATEKLGSDCVANLFQIIQQYKNDGGSVIYATKQWEEALKVADSISILGEGKIKDTLAIETAKNDPHKLLNLLENYDYREDKNNLNEESKEILDTVFKAAEFLTSEYELDDVLLLLARQVSKVMNADGCIIDLIDDGTDSIIDSLEYKPRQDLEFKLKNETILKLSRKNDIYYSTKKEKGFDYLFQKKRNVKTIICIPVLIRSRITGIIQIFYRELYVYSEKEAKYLSTFARHAALAIEETRLMGRSALLQESHHRIKNNLQSIISLISLQRRMLKKNEEKSIDDIFNDITSRIKSIAAVHDLLSKDELGRSIINIREIIEVIIDFTNIKRGIRIDLELEDILIPYNRASSIALITNELVLNCIKHAFPEEGGGLINITCRREGKSVLLMVEDNGRGLPENFDLEGMDSLGLTIVDAIIKNEFNGQMSISRRKDGGTRVRIFLPSEKVFLGEENRLSEV